MRSGRLTSAAGSNVIRAGPSHRSIEREGELRDERGATPVRDQTLRICQRIDLPAGRGTRIAGEDEAIFLRQVGVGVAQVEVEFLCVNVTPAFQVR